MKIRLLRFIIPITMFFISSADASGVFAKKIMPLGDSITRGVSGSDFDWGYRKPLYDLLANGGYSFDFVGSTANGDFPDPNHEGHDGWRADQILTYIEVWMATYQPDVVLLHIGTNDIIQGNQDANEVNAILNVIDDYEAANNKVVTVIVALIINRVPYSSATTQYNNDVEIMASNRVAGGDDIIVVDMEVALDYSIDLVADGIHPNDTGYAKMAAVWYDALTDFPRDSLDETDQRLELRTQGGLLSSLVFYTSNGWRLGVAGNFAIKIDFHYGSISEEESWIGLNVGDDANYVLISAGSDGGQPYFYYEAVVDGIATSAQEPRAINDGTLYVSFNSTMNEFYLSHTGFGSTNAYAPWTAPNPNPTQGQWLESVKVSIGGGSSGTILGPGEAYLDNFEVAEAILLDWPPATDFDRNGYIELYDLSVICENWLKSGLGDIDSSGQIDLFDLIELASAW
ncbi:MAG: hypothetical protein JW749_07290 [Sedimentisphaerales bacterium]|nr:hypothetical protein [Sedimentisphaerales bacterium]